jgi:hypothetical protein
MVSEGEMRRIIKCFIQNKLELTKKIEEKKSDGENGVVFNL